jgi:hypothetical protein
MKNSILSLVGAAAVLGAASAYATPATAPAIRWSFDGGTTWSTPVVDQDSNDNDIIVGSIGVVIHNGALTLSVNTSGSTKPNTGTAANPQMDLNLGAGGLASGKVIVEFTDIGFGPIPGGSYITTAFNNNGSVSATYYTIVGGNTAFDGAGFSGGVPTGSPITTIGPVAAGASSQTKSASGPAGQTDPYSITLVTVLDFGSGTRSTISTDQKLTVPDGGNTLMLLGSALSVLGLGVFRSSRKAAVKA